ncbi:MAG: TrmH family RNA methyltransferase [Patescibacteria group bacterium]|nr:TrmH family RNA methyltransferase [Patescibacteria group bacterium]
MSTKKFPIYLVVQNVRSLYNVGSIFRCADVFGVDKIFLCGYTGFPPRKEISKTALGAETWIPWERQWQTHLVVKKLKTAGFKIIALETGEHNVSLPKFKPAGPIALVVGSEVNGISRSILALADKKVVIPMLGKKESLNVAVATGIALYALRN